MCCVRNRCQVSKMNLNSPRHPAMKPLWQIRILSIITSMISLLPEPHRDTSSISIIGALKLPIFITGHRSSPLMTYGRIQTRSVAVFFIADTPTTDLFPFRKRPVVWNLSTILLQTQPDRRKTMPWMKRYQIRIFPRR